MMAISEIEIVGVLQFAVRTSAMKLGIRDVEWKSIEELLAEISAIDAETYRLLKSFLDAYMTWFRFHRRMDEMGKQGQLDADEKQELHDLMDRRDTTRKAILNRLAKVASMPKPG